MIDEFMCKRHLKLLGCLILGYLQRTSIAAGVELINCPAWNR